ncbi:MAG TPA: hypothetical protein VNX47_09835 [Nevskia sp.]|nr:hypothetical protein [Nevskia sp.]
MSQLQVLAGLVVSGALAAFLLAIGLRGLIHRRPFLISSRWLFLLCVLAFLPGLRPFLAHGNAISPLTWMNLAMFLIFGVAMWLVTAGYSAFGVTEASFRQGLYEALRRRGLPWEEALGGMNLPTEDAAVQVGMHSWIGTAQIKVLPRGRASLLRDIAAGMNAYYRSATVPVNLAPCLVYAVMGGVLLVFAVMLV